ncbi:MAG: ABC transporter permease, partial [Calditrichia bacterium]
MYFWIQMGEYLKFAWEALKANKVRSFLTTLGILIGVTTIILIFTLIQSINAYVEGEFSNIGATSVYVSKFPWVITDNFFELRNRPPVTIKEYDALYEQVTYARWISPNIQAMRAIKYKNKSLERVLTVGCNEEYTETNNVATEYGRWFTPTEVKHGRYVCIIGNTVREELFEKEDPLGKRIKINGLPYKVIGVMEKKGNFFGFNMDNQVIIPYTTFRGYALHRRGLTIALKVDDPAKLDDLKEEIRGILRKVRRLSPKEEDNFAINQQNMLTDFYKQVTRTSYMVILIVAAISLIVGGIGIMNIMLVSVTERTREIGIRKAVGATRGQIMLQFIWEAITISMLGGILGMICGVLLSQIPLNLMKLNAQVTPATVLIGFGFTTFVGIVSGSYPAYKAAKLDPIEA